MEKQVRILQDFGYAEYQSNGETKAKRGFLLDDGIDYFYAEMSSSVAKREKETTYDFTRQHIYRAKVRVKAGTDEIIVRPEAQGKPTKKNVVEKGDSEM